MHLLYVSCQFLLKILMAKNYNSEALTDSTGQQKKAMSLSLLA